MRVALLVLLALAVLPIATALSQVQFTVDGQPVRFVKLGVPVSGQISFVPTQGSYYAQVTSEQAPAATRLTTNTCTTCSADFTLIGSQTVHITIDEDLGDKLVSDTTTLTFGVDDTPPQISDIKIGDCEAGCAYGPKTNKLRFSITDTQSGLRNESLRVRVGNSIVEPTCTSTQRNLVCEVPLEGSSDKTIIIQAADVAGNTVEEQRDVRYDGTAPEFLDTPSFKTGTSQLAGGQSHIIQVRVREPERATIALNSTIANATGTCTRIDDETNSLECIVTFSPPNKRQSTTGKILVTDAAGNTAETSIYLDVYEGDKTAQPNFWDVKVSTSSRLDVETWQVLDKRIPVHLTLKPVQTTSAIPVQITATCTWGSVVITPEYIVPKRDTQLVLVLARPTENIIDSGQLSKGNLSCVIKTTTRIGSTIFTTAEEDTAQIKLETMRLPPPREEIKLARDQVQEDIRSQQQKLQGLSQIQFALTSMCSASRSLTLGTATTLMATGPLLGLPFDGGTTANNMYLIAQALDVSAEGLQKATQPLCEAMACDGSLLWGDVFGEGFNKDWIGSVGDYDTDKIKAEAQNAANTQANKIRDELTAKAAEAQKDLSPEAKKIDGRVPPPGSPDNTNDIVEGLNGFRAGLGVQLSPAALVDPYRSEYAAMMMGCFPAYVEHQYAKLDYRCDYQSCLSNLDITGQSVAECNQDFELQQCLYNRGSLYFALPGTAIVDSALSQLELITSSPLALVGVARTVVCSMNGLQQSIFFKLPCALTKMPDKVNEVMRIWYNLQDAQRQIQRISAGASATCKGAQDTVDSLKQRIELGTLRGPGACRVGYSVHTINGKQYVGYNGNVYASGARSVDRPSTPDEVAATGLSDASGQLTKVDARDPAFGEAFAEAEDCQQLSEKEYEDFAHSLGESWTTYNSFVTERQNAGIALAQARAGLAQAENAAQGHLTVPDDLRNAIQSDPTLSPANKVAALKAIERTYDSADTYMFRTIDQRRMSLEEYTAQGYTKEQYDAALGGSLLAPSPYVNEHTTITVSPEEAASAFRNALITNLDEALPGNQDDTQLAIVTRIAQQKGVDINVVMDNVQNIALVKDTVKDAQLEYDITRKSEKAAEGIFKRAAYLVKVSSTEGYTQDIVEGMVSWARTGKLAKQAFGWDFGAERFGFTAVSQKFANARTGLEDALTINMCEEDAHAVQGRGLSFTGSGTAVRISASLSPEKQGTKTVYDYNIDVYIKLPNPIDEEVSLVLKDPYNHVITWQEMDMEEGFVMLLNDSSTTRRTGTNAIGITNETKFRRACIVFNGPIQNYILVQDQIPKDSNELCTQIEEARTAQPR